MIVEINDKHMVCDRERKIGCLEYYSMFKFYESAVITFNDFSDPSKLLPYGLFCIMHYGYNIPEQNSECY